MVIFRTRWLVVLILTVFTVKNNTIVEDVWRVEIVFESLMYESV